jgi:predicted DNA-binding transcriptional regulator AlpA
MPVLREVRGVSAGRDRQNFSLANVARDPKLIAKVPKEALPALFCELGAISIALAARLMELEPLATHSEQSEDRLLTVTETAERLGLKSSYLYRHSDKFPFTRRPAPHQLRFSSRGIDEYIRRSAVNTKFHQ